MSLADDKKICGTCRRLGLKRKAHRIMANKTARCDEHYREEAGLSQLNDEARCFIDRCHELEREKTHAHATQVDRCGPSENAKPVVRGIEPENHQPAVSRQLKSGKKNSHKSGHRHPQAHQMPPHALTVSELRRSWEEL